MLYTHKNRLTAFILLLLGSLSLNAQIKQPKPVLGIMEIPTKNLSMEESSGSGLVRLEAEKTDQYQVLQKYDIQYHLQNTNIDIKKCLSKHCLVQAGHKTGADKMLSGTIERYGDKITVVLRLINVQDSTIEKSEIKEFVNQPEYIQKMVKLSIRDLFGLEINKNLEKKLLYHDVTISAPSKLVLNGPRIGIAYVTGRTKRILERPEDQGGYDMYPYVSQFGYQYELQYMSAGEIQGLIEFIGFLGGVDQGVLIPTLSILNGIRHNKWGLEFAFGPTFGIAEKGKVFYDKNRLLDNQKKWYLAKDWSKKAKENGLTDDNGIPRDLPYDTQFRRDSRSNQYYPTYSWVWAVGKTFRSGPLNIPVNAYVSPGREGWFVGLTVGFNVAQRRARKE